MPTDNLDPYFAKVFKPGAVILTSGFKGGGKSHTAVAVAEQLIKGFYPSVGPVEVFTNMIFFHKVNGEILEECPPGVHRVTTMMELFPMLMDSSERHNGKVLNLIILDEAQAFIGGDSNQNNASKMMKDFLAIIRKFHAAMWFLTPSARAIGPAFRNYLNDPAYPGNLTAKLFKNLEYNERYIEERHLDYRPNELMLVKNFDLPVRMLRVPVTEWTVTKDELREGQYCYDHEAPATFYEGDGFDWPLFNRTIGGVSSIRMAQTVRDYYRKHHPTDGVRQDPRALEERRRIEEDSKLDMAKSLISSGRMTQAQVASMMGLTRDQLQYRLRKRTDYYSDKAESLVSGRSRTRSNPLREALRDDATETQASGAACVREKGADLPSIYISCRDRENTVSFERPSRNENSENRSENGHSSTPKRVPHEGPAVPDGRYDMDDFRRAVDAMLGDDDD